MISERMIDLLSRERVLEVFKEAGVLQKGHFLLTSGRHSDTYLQVAKIFRNTKYSSELCEDLANSFKDDKIDVVIGPAIGAIQMSYEVSRYLNCENFFAERENGKLTLRRGFKIEKGMRVLVVEDVVTTGGTVREVIDIVKEQGGIVAGVGLIVDRTNGKVDFGAPLRSVIAFSDIQSWTPEECPICKDKDIPLVKPGSRKQ